MEAKLLVELQYIKELLEEGKIPEAEAVVNRAITILLSQGTVIPEETHDPNDNQVYNPSHYQSYKKDGIDCITAMQHAFGDEAVATFCKLNAFKYNWRSESKGGNTDIEKAVWYLNKYLELNKK